MLKTEKEMKYMIITNGIWTVYCHINKINNKMYVGITSKENPNKRWRNGNGYFDTPHFKAAINKYGWDNFEHIIIASHLTEEEACNFEKLLIKKLNLTDSKYGYNISEGGNKGCLLSGSRHPMYGKHHTEEAKEKNRLKHIRKTFNLSDEAKEKISIALKGNNNGVTVRVMCIETGVVYVSLAEAQRKTGADASAISKCIRGKMHQTHGLRWKIA